MNKYRLRDFDNETILDYEVMASWWACLIWWGWGHTLAAKYYAWKVNRKLGRVRRRNAGIRRLVAKVAGIEEQP